MKYGSWCYCCYNLICTSPGFDLNRCNRCEQRSNNHLPPSKFKPGNICGGFNKKEEKNMIVTIIGSLTKKKEMDKIKAFWKRHGAVVNSPGDPEVQKEPLENIQRTWIEKIEEADLIVAVPKDVTLMPNRDGKYILGFGGDSKYALEFGESTSYEIAIARRFNKPILFG